MDKFKVALPEQRRDILAALGTEHLLRNNILTIKTEKPLLLIQEVASSARGTGKILEPPNEPSNYSSNGKTNPASLPLWA